MSNTGVFACKQFMDKEGVILSINGQMSQSILVEVGGTLKKRLEEEGAETKVSRKVFSIFIEQMQNILRYSDARVARDNDEEDSSLGILLVGSQDGHYYVKCGNLIKKQKEVTLTQQMEKIRAMDASALKAYYKEVRRSGPPPDSKGAGLGVIDMARMASRPIEYGFDTVDAEFSFFSISVFI